MTTYNARDISKFLKELNLTYTALHKRYEEYFWKSYMGEPAFDSRMTEAMDQRDAFRSNPEHFKNTKKLIRHATGEQKDKLNQWKKFFEHYQVPKKAQELRKEIGVLENTIAEKMNFRKEGYLDPKTKKFITMSYTQMRTAMRVEDNEKLRKAYFNGCEALCTFAIDEYIELVNLRNQYAQTLGYEDFYSYKVEHEDNMTKKELFSIFDTVYDKTKYAFKDLRNLEKKKKNLRKPWNFSYMMSGDIIQEEDQYFNLNRALNYWGQAFQNMGITMARGKLKLDLIDRVGKYPNGFCHWPNIVHYKGTRKIPGSANFTCNAVINQMGSGEIAMNTLFHEGGHAAHFLNSEETEVCNNTEYLPMTSAWAETQSMFADSIFNSIEWKTRYARNNAGEYYPFDLYKKSLKKTIFIRPLYMMGIHGIMSFERDIYESKKLTKAKVISIAKKNYKKYFDRSEDSMWMLNVPHIYSFESSGSYHGYGLAKMAVVQWREYFIKKYGYIVDNKEIGKEMKEVWKYGARFTFKEFVKMATGKAFSPAAFIKNITMSEEELLQNSQSRIDTLKEIKKPQKKIKLKGLITMVHGNRKIANNMVSFEDMARRYAKWINMQKKQRS